MLTPAQHGRRDPKCISQCAKGNDGIHRPRLRDGIHCMCIELAKSMTTNQMQPIMLLMLSISPEVGDQLQTSDFPVVRILI
jgi:hypothetical protein